MGLTELMIRTRLRLPVLIQPKKTNKYKLAIKAAKENHKEAKDKYTMYCPYCGAPLIATDRLEKLETLDEHVSGAEVTPKTVYKCSEECISGQYAKYNYMGESYFDCSDLNSPEMRKAVYKVLYHDTDAFDSKVGYPSWSLDAINSISYSSHCSVYHPGKRDRIALKFKKNQKVFPVISFDYKYGYFGEALTVSPKIEWIVNGYVEPSIRRRFCWKIDDTWRSYKKYKKTGKETALKQLYGIYYGIPLSQRDWIWRFWYSKVVPIIYGKILGVKPLKDENHV